MKRIAKPQKQLAPEIPQIERIGIVRVQPEFAIVVSLHVPHMGVTLDNHYAKHHQYHHLSNALEVVSDLAL